ncbi:MAG: MBL fold metallo-hydrolase [Eubacteriales bacterium]|nr:MBL fold metallo-hydrolase [Eubacteriales bacterium]
MDKVMIFGSYVPWKLDASTWIIQFMNGSEYMYLLEGEEKALLIDTGWGSGNLRALVEKLTDKPILVVNSHFHPDHAGGNGEFEQVYVSRRYADDVGTLSESLMPFDLSRLPHPDYVKILIGEGFVFDLGNREVEVMEARNAHCNSSLFFLDRSHRMIFTGDEFESAQSNLFNDPLNEKGEISTGREVFENFTANAKRIWELRDAYDLVLPNHNGSPMAKCYIEEYAELYDALLKGDVTVEDKLNHFYIEQDPKAPRLCRVRYKGVSVFAYKEDVKELKGSI